MIKNKLIIFALIVLAMIFTIPITQAVDCVNQGGMCYSACGGTHPTTFCCPSSSNCNQWEKTKYNQGWLTVNLGCDTCSDDEGCVNNEACCDEAYCAGYDYSVDDADHDLTHPTGHCIVKQASDNYCRCTMLKSINGVRCTYSDYNGDYTTCCSSGNCVENYCCNYADCSAAGSGVRIDPVTGNCDAHTAGQLGYGVYCGTPTCAGGSIDDRSPPVPVAAGTCGCVADIATKYYDDGLLTNNATYEFNRGYPASVVWYDVYLKGTNISGIGSAAHAEFAYCTKASCSATDWSLYNTPSDPGFPTITVYPDDIQNSTEFKLKINLSTNPFLNTTPSIDRAYIRSLPRLYNSDDNIKQLPAQAQCWPITETNPKSKVSCSLDYPNTGLAIGKVGCNTSTLKNTTRVKAELVNTGFTESNETDNVKIVRDYDWCYQLDESNAFMSREGEGAICTSNTDCFTLCCVYQMIGAISISTDGTCQTPTRVDVPIPQPGYHNYTVMYNNTSNDGALAYCGIHPEQWDAAPCFSDFDCATNCCDTASATCALGIHDAWGTTDYSNCMND